MLKVAPKCSNDRKLLQTRNSDTQHTAKVALKRFLTLKIRHNSSLSLIGHGCAIKNSSKTQVRVVKIV